MNKRITMTAFEASFASAFPETPFSINNDKPKEAKIGQITLNVRDFGDDPLFNNFNPNTNTHHTMVFDSTTPISFDDMSASSSSNKGGSLSGMGKKGKNRLALAPLSPQSMTAEIEQLDAAMANLSGGSDKSGGSGSVGSDNRILSRKIRNVKQPVSYAEPSTKSKLRRGVSMLCCCQFCSLCTINCP